MKLTAWRFTDNIYIYRPYDGRGILISNPENKKYYGPVAKIAESIQGPELLSNTGVTIEIKDSDFWLDGKKILNAHKEDLLDVFSGITIKSGKAEGVRFGFCPLFPDKVQIIFPGTEYYNKSESEYFRKIQLDLVKKTTKFIPGHRYEHDLGTFWYLGELRSHIKYFGSGDSYLQGNETKAINAFVNHLPESKSVDEIFQTYQPHFISFPKTEILEKTILLSEQNKPMVDSGMELVLGKSPEENYEERLKTFISENKEAYTYGSTRTFYRSLSKLLQIFLISEKDTVTVSQNIKDEVQKILKSNLFHILFREYNVEVNRYGENILESESLRRRRNALINRFLSTICPNGNYYSNEYHISMIKSLFDIDLNILADEVLNDFLKNNPPDLSTFSNLIDNFGYLEFRSPDSFEKVVDFEYVSVSKRRMETFLPDDKYYREIITKIYLNALDTNGADLEYFAVSNIGTKKSPVFRYEFTIGLKDILKYLTVKSENLNDLPDKMKESILCSKIYKLKFIVRSDINVYV